MVVWKVHLASASSRRFEWLKGRLEGESVDFTAAGLISDEASPPGGLDVKSQVQRILDSKVESAKIEIAIQGLSESEIPNFLLVGDTLVEDPDDIQQSLGQPDDKTKAAVMLLRLSGRRHNVWSGTAMLSRENSNWTVKSAVEYATVEINQLSDLELAELLNSNSWQGKAGAYDLAGKMGNHARLISGSEVCVLGFASSIIEELLQLISGQCSTASGDEDVA
jgi:septum formation protein